jgi:F-type H+-transporting ATPase subunit delta
VKDRKLATRYARALLDALRSDPAAAERADEFLTALSSAMAESAGLRGRLLDPAVPRSERIGTLRALAGESGLPREIGNFLSAVVEHNRVGSLASIAEVFHEEREAAMGIVPAEIRTASPLPDDLRDRARRALERLTGRKVRLTTEVEPALIGGAVTRVGSQIYDGSLRTQLAQLRRKMTEE